MAGRRVPEALRGAAYAVASGAVDIALAVGAEKLKDAGYGGLPAGYKGTFNGEDNEQMQLRLLANLKAQGLKPAGLTGFAGYDAPSTLPFLRRNEAWVELA